jgi:DNA-binding LacI/PurR family transcriptional regulator
VQVSSPRAAKPVSIVDVARAANVSAATVSRALTKPELVAHPTLAKIQSAIEQTGYIPNRAARGLITGRTGNVAVVVPDIVNPFFAQVVRGIQRVVRPHDQHVFLVDTNETDSEEVIAIRSIGPQVDAVVLVAPRLAHRRLDELGSKPCVFVNRLVVGYPSVLIRSSQAMREAFRHLSGLGHRRVVYLGGPRNSWSAQERLRVARRMASELSLDLSVVGPNDPSVESGATLADRVLESRATAVITFNDQMALGVVNELQSRGVMVPKDISVVGCDDIPMADTVSPALTTLAVPAVQAGEVAGRAVLAAGEADGLHQTLAARLVVRSSTGAAPTETRR